MSERTARALESWWHDELGVAGTVLHATLLPAELAFRAAVRARGAAYARGVLKSVRAPIPVVSVGNIAVGGTGKTPFAAFLARRLLALGHAPALLHGGYAADEPELHRQWNPDVPVFAGRDRAAGARRAAAEGASVAILDDGFQHRRLARDIDLVLVSAETWTSAPRLLPRGPWREGPAALQRASAIVITERTTEAPLARGLVRTAIERAAPGVPVWSARMRPEHWRRAASPDQAAGAPPAPALAVAAIAQPTLFVTGARSAGAHIAELLAFRDHHDYTAPDAARIRARAAGRPIVTTAKDWVKLRRLLEPDHVWILEQHVAMTDGAAALDALLASLPGRP